MTPFQNCVWQSRHPTNMATVAKNRKGGMKSYLFSTETTGPVGDRYPFKILSGSPVLGPRWTLLLNINDFYMVLLV